MITHDHHFELLPSIDATDGAAFGIGLPVGLDADGFAPGSTDWAIQDTEDPTSGATLFGRERLLGPTWSWQLHIDTESESEALAALRPFRRAWHATHIRDTPGAVLPLRFQLDGERRRIYGRPRRFEAPPDNKILGGYVPVSVDFKCVDGFVYDDEFTSVTMQLGMGLDDPDYVDSGGGFIFPVVFPAASLPPRNQRTQLVIGGDEAAYPIVRFDGPVLNPALVTDDWTLSLDYFIPAGQYVEVDTRPWQSTVLLNGNAGLGGALGRRQRLSRIRFAPGERFEAKYVGASSGVSTCTVRWASTHSSY